MEMTLPCNAHPAVWPRYKKSVPRPARTYPTPERHQLSRDKYAKYVSERRRRRACSEAVSRLLAELNPLAISLEERFREQADKWRRETEHLSSPSQMMMHPSYQAILGMAQGHEQD